MNRQVGRLGGVRPEHYNDIAIQIAQKTGALLGGSLTSEMHGNIANPYFNGLRNVFIFGGQMSAIKAEVEDMIYEDLKCVALTSS
jgi:hypothetical protein